MQVLAECVYEGDYKEVKPLHHINHWKFPSQVARKRLSVTHLLAAQYQKLNCLAARIDKWVKNDSVQLILFGRGTSRPHFNRCANWLSTSDWNVQATNWRSKTKWKQLCLASSLIGLQLWTTAWTNDKVCDNVTLWCLAISNNQTVSSMAEDWLLCISHNQIPKLQLEKISQFVAALASQLRPLLAWEILNGHGRPGNFPLVRPPISQKNCEWVWCSIRVNVTDMAQWTIHGSGRSDQRDSFLRSGWTHLPTGCWWWQRD